LAGSGGPRSRTVAEAGEIAVNEATADTVVTTGSDTTLTKTFPLAEGAAFSIRNTNGSITVATWDQPKAVVKVIRRNSDRNVQVFVNSSQNNLSIRSADTRGGQDVRYEVMVPSELGRVEINSINGAVKVSGLTGEITVQGTNGAIELAGLSGVSRVRNTNGRA
jgi:hypothetical protein